MKPENELVEKETGLLMDLYFKQTLHQKQFLFFKTVLF